jgi:hypothetical protein
LLRGTPNARIDDLIAGITQDMRNVLRTAIVAIEADLPDEDAFWDSFHVGVIGHLTPCSSFS